MRRIIICLLLRFFEFTGKSPDVNWWFTSSDNLRLMQRHIISLIGINSYAVLGEVLKIFTFQSMWILLEAVVLDKPKYIYLKQ